MNEFKLIIAGGRDFNDAALLERVLIALADTEYADKAISIVSGMANGADMLGYKFAVAHDIVVYTFHAQWKKPDGTTDRGAGHRRNEQMGRFADGLLAFHDGVSPGTAGMICFMKTLGKPVTVINY